MNAATLKSWVPVVIGFLSSRIIYFCLGVRFDATPMPTHYQYLDTLLLRDNLLQSVYYMHIQPPLFNLLLGVMLKLFPSHWPLAFNGVYLFMGLVLSIVLYQTIRELGVSSGIASWLTIIFVASPACVLYENYLFYTYPTTLLLAASALCLHRAMARPTVLNAHLFFLLLAAIALTRSLFHILWFAFFALAVILLQRQHFRRLAVAAAVPFALVLFWYARNLCLFGEFNSSSFLGMSLSKMTTFMLPEAERRQLVRENKLSELSLIQPFSGLDAYERFLPKTEPTGIPVLDSTRKIGMIQDWNRNYIGYLHISRGYLKDAHWSLAHRPGTYLVSIVKSWDLFFRPASNYVFLGANRRAIRPINRLYNLVILGQILDTFPEGARGHPHTSGNYGTAIFRMGLFLVIAFFGLLIFGFGLIRKALAQRPVDWPFAATVMFIWANILYVAIVGNCLEMGENFRFRFMIDPFLVILLGLFLHHLWAKFGQSQRSRAA